MTAPVFAIGDIVTSKYSSSGALWEVESVVQERRSHYLGDSLALVSVKSGRHDKRYARDIVLAPDASASPTKRIAAAIEFVNEFGARTEDGDNASAELIAILEGKS